MNKQIVWDKSFETGIDEVDAQHRQLVEIINELEAGIGRASIKDLQGILSRLKEYAQHHFRTEEGIMEAKTYPGLKDHKAEHRTFVDQLLLFDLDIILASEGLAWEMFHYLRGWLTNHILVVDRKFAAASTA